MAVDTGFDPTRSTSRTPEEVQQVLEADTGSDPNSLSILVDREQLHVGETERHAFDLFTKPKNADVFQKLPPKLPQDLKANAWETNNEGFGVISKDGKVLLAMHTSLYVETEAFPRIVEEYKRKFPASRFKIDEVGRGEINYAFWQPISYREGDLPIRLMVASAKNDKGVLSLTIAVGLDALMDSLRMNAVDAPKDAAQAFDLIQKTGIKD